jgi:hypothetical protein
VSGWSSISCALVFVAACSSFNEYPAGGRGAGPSVVFTSPGDGAQEVGLMGPIVVRFGDGVDGRTVTAASFSVIGLDGEVPGIVTFENEEAEFVPADPFAILTRYRISLDPAKIKGLNGVSLMHVADWSFTTREGVWRASSEKMLGSHGPIPVGTHLAMNVKGDAALAWVHGDPAAGGLDREIQVSRYTIAGGWSTPARYGAGELAGGNVHYQVAVEDTGNVALLWTVFQRLWYGRYIGGAWSAAFRIPVDITGGAWDVRLVATGGDRFGCVWRSERSDTRMSGSVFSIAAGMLDAAVDVSGPLGSLSSEIALAGSPSSNATLALWQNIRPDSRADLWGSSVQQAVQRQISDGEGSVASPDLAIDGFGNAVAVWIQADATMLKAVRSAWRPPHGDWAPLTAVAGAAPGTARPIVAGDARGNFMALWEQAEGSDRVLYAARWTPAAAKWSPAVRISEIGSTAREASLALDGSGNGFAAWVSSSSGRSAQIEVARFVAASESWEPSSARSSLDAQSQAGLTGRILLDGKGRGFLAITKNAKVIVQRFD